MQTNRKDHSLLVWRSLCLVLILSNFTSIFAQQDGFAKEGIFRGTRVINGHATQSLRSGEMEFIISHRFGRLNGGAYELFGLDQASIRFGLDYGINDWLTVGIGRSSFEKTYDGFTKIRLFRGTSNKFPLSVTYLGSIAIRTIRDNDPVRDYFSTSRLFFTHQILMAKKLGERLSLQLMPTLVHRNYVETALERHDVWSLGLASRYRVNKNLAVTLEYYYTLPDQLAPGVYNSLSLGFEIETSGHIFQLHLSNSQGMIEKFFISETTGRWLDGDIHIGFNMGRTFKLKGRWY